MRAPAGDISISSELVTPVVRDRYSLSVYIMKRELYSVFSTPRQSPSTRQTASSAAARQASVGSNSSAGMTTPVRAKASPETVAVVLMRSFSSQGTMSAPTATPPTCTSCVALSSVAPPPRPSVTKGV